jgi:hypothetical protein
MLYYTNAEGMKMFEKLKRFWKNLWGDNLPPEPVRKQVEKEIPKEERSGVELWTNDVISRAPKVPPTASHKPMETTPKFKNELMRNAIPELNKKRQEATLGYGLKSRNFRPRPAYEKRLYDLRKKPEKEED